MSRKAELNLSRKNKIYFAIGKDSAAMIFCAVLLLLVLYLIINTNNPRALVPFMLGVNFLLLLALGMVYKLENLTKDRALRVITKISRVKLIITNLDELLSLICTTLEEELVGKFSIVLNDDVRKIEMNAEYFEKAKKILRSAVPLTIARFDKIIYFRPLICNDKKIGVLVGEMNSRHDFNFTLRKILPEQIAIIISNFQTRRKLHDSNITQERERLRSLILSSISHDLKTPLSSIIGGLSVFNALSSRNKLDEKSKKTLIDTALEEAERLNDFISEVLEMTRIESGAIKLQMQPLEPSCAIEKVLKRFERKLKNYVLDVRIQEKVKINFDATSLEQVIQNIIDNNIKYAPKDTKISLWDKLTQDAYYIFIKDEGRGIHPDKLNLIFNKFERFSYEDKVVGSGLGLSIVKALMELNGAKVMAKNSDGGTGAIFVLEFNDFIKSRETT